MLKRYLLYSVNGMSAVGCVPVWKDKLSPYCQQKCFIPLLHCVKNWHEDWSCLVCHLIIITELHSCKSWHL